MGGAGRAEEDQRRGAELDINTAGRHGLTAASVFGPVLPETT